MKNDLTLRSAIDLLKKGEITSADLVEKYLGSIDRDNKKLNAFLTVNEKALEKAKAINNRPNDEKPLLGVPIAIKDIFLTKGLRTTASSKLLDDYIPQYSATVVRLLEDAGAIILGKTNLDAWCHGSSTETSDYGPTRNPWNLDHVPGGSSGGSAAAVAGDLAICAMGTETAGSVRGPAAWCGIVGLKPTYGRVSRYGVIAMGSSLDSPGPLTKNVEDSALLLNVIAGNDPYDATTSALKSDDYTKFLKKGVKGLKIGLAEDYLLPQMDEEVKNLVKNTAKVFEKLGAKVEIAKTLDPRLAIPVYTVVQRSEVSSNLARFDGIRYGNGREYFSEEAKRRIMLGTFSLSTGYQDKYYKKAQKVRTLFIENFALVFKKFDLLIGPTMPGPAPKIGVTEGQAMFGEMADVLTEPTSISGLPGISVPCGFVGGLPVGLNIFGPQFSEGLIIQTASAYEQATQWHEKVPEMIETL
ncbi:glutaminyl-tRNA synthase (glutamine-hydrolyzing) subunit A [Candidatus Woesebacteria bacterium RIFCSPHIGHO2_01_FULL_38_9]|uniref:Glutamyl-tRNA(Gln) amidotransferase subunit A n=2 Tax=Candidatus Woeseibacteriota TaxID=1752722 RepID=A0A1F7Y4N5_9BACT|nr:MAG: glutaminyl-tRNA synthase (glutamine-hydrolyzing) subunit A [Candidatus Woesebacteria bacterium RIFCSPHIGHO2_01_FULL_38_9]OGM58264.1 MAG: glutaminyl-tRNA synthase (glutamine-hydrolyzing) subunit A [Candidatus Woesebacteria bacterium RIFCSPLOWO2_01_FULL_39_10]